MNMAGVIRMKYLYECGSCGETFEYDDKGMKYCDWFDCENDDPLEYVGMVVADTK